MAVNTSWRPREWWSRNNRSTAARPRFGTAARHTGSRRFHWNHTSKRWLAVRRNAAHALIHSLVGKPIGIAIALAQRVLHGKPFKLPDQGASAVIELHQVGAANLIYAAYLSHHQFGIADYLEGLGGMLHGIIQRRQQSHVLRVIVGIQSDKLADFFDPLAVVVFDHHSETCRAGIATGAAVHVRNEVGFRSLLHSRPEK